MPYKNLCTNSTLIIFSVCVCRERSIMSTALQVIRQIYDDMFAKLMDMPPKERIASLSCLRTVINAICVWQATADLLANLSQCWISCPPTAKSMHFTSECMPS